MKIVNRILVQFLIICCLSQIATTQSCRMTDSLVLVTLYNQTDGPNWTDSWDLNQPMDTWNGVTLNANECLSELFLSNNNLTGEIPEELGDLSEIDRIFFGGNNLTGGIPLELFQLEKLRVLYLNRNDLTGGIPTEISTMPALEVLSVRDNPNLGGPIPPELGTMPNLIELRFGNSGLTGTIPASLANLDLKQFLLGQNNLTGPIPPELGSFINLKNWFDVSNNQLTGEIPVELGNLINCERLNLSGNEFTGEIPEELQNLTNAITFKLNNNQLEGEIPEWIADFEGLEDLQLSANDFSGCFPESFMELCDVNFRRFSGNPQMPWSGDFDAFCTGDPQMGAPCDDEDPNTDNDVIQSDCSCKGISTTGIDDFKFSHFTVYPNPSTDQLYISFTLPAPKALQIKLYHLLGQSIWEEQYDGVLEFNQLIDVSQLSSGQYLLSIQDKNGTSSKITMVEKF